MESSLIGKSMSKEDYQNYIEKIVNIFRMSTDRSSILFDLKIVDSKATANLSIIDQDGQKQEFSDVILDCNQDFFNYYLIPLIQRICEIVNIPTKDIVNLSDNSLVTFRMITEHNDLFSIDGLSPDDANSLLSISEGTKSNPSLPIPSNEQGIGNTLIFLMMIGLFAVAFIIIVGIIK